MLCYDVVMNLPVLVIPSAIRLCAAGFVFRHGTGQNLSMHVCAEKAHLDCFTDHFFARTGRLSSKEFELYLVRQSHHSCSLFAQSILL